MAACGRVNITDATASSAISQLSLFCICVFIDIDVSLFPETEIPERFSGGMPRT
jgi:hypothetical protein